MGGVPVKHHSKGKVGRRRSHLALKQIQVSVCSNCRGPVLSHRTCKQCGTYSKKTASTAKKTVSTQDGNTATG